MAETSDQTPKITDRKQDTHEMCTKGSSRITASCPRRNHGYCSAPVTYLDEKTLNVSSPYGSRGRCFNTPNIKTRHWTLDPFYKNGRKIYHALSLT